MGTSRIKVVFTAVDQDHPHAYGDKLYVLIYWYRALGSSPRVWGQGTFHAISFAGSRIIPTRMGTSNKEWEKDGHSGDHPHAYGDKFDLIGIDDTVSGSSPRVWGQDYVFGKMWRKHRIIPTRMGTSLVFLSSIILSPGSSPRVWGQD